ncbi:sensor histidine kinase [Fodinicola acaciae]|uniref:sensor histidine kinase n=1 Tax=Fodinicola acaciae TaxID=2681555 RepID=UPI0016529DD8|nr:HAMP domain-containing sensor histidine kinase [Fodinicola acaciae]
MTVRARLTLWYGGMLILSGLVLMVVTYVLFLGTLHGNIAKVVVDPKNDPGLSKTIDKLQSGAYSQRDSALLKAQIAAKQRAVENAAAQSLVTNSAIALGLVSVFAMCGGWVLAGRALRPLDRALSNQRRFVADASHELRTPLAVNRTLLEVAAARPDASDDVRVLAGKLLEATARHEKLLDGLLTLARSDEGRTARTPVDLADVTAAAVEVSRRPAEKAGVELRTTLKPAVCLGDPVLLERVVLNLLQNAVTYNHSGGQVDIQTSHPATLTVTNSGPVVGAEQTDEIFQPFHRLGPRTAGTGRVGLGLAIVRSVAVAHGGSVTATARPEGGLTVVFTLPKA